MAFIQSAPAPIGNNSFTRSWLQKTGPSPTPAGSGGGSTRPASGQMYPRTK